MGKEGGVGVGVSVLGKLRVISLMTAFRSAGVGNRAGGRKACRLQEGKVESGGFMTRGEEG